MPTLGWAQTIISPFDIETNFKVNKFSCQYASPSNDIIVIESDNGEAILPIKNKKNVVIFAEGYLANTIVAFPDTTHIVKLSKSFYNLARPIGIIGHQIAIS